MPVFLLLAAAVVSDVKHEPAAPKPGAAVVVSARVAASPKSVTLQIQPVAPGKYIRKGDAAFEQGWVDLPMHDDGQEGDAKAGDGIYSVRVPAEHQNHRWLIRYRVAVVDRAGAAHRYPAADSAVPNQAWYCDAGPSAWTGSRDPGRSPPQTFSTEFLGTLQSLTLLARSEDVERSQWDGRGHKQKIPGTIVYRGVVYDHIQFSNRGQGSAHISGKNKWDVKFHDSQRLPFADHDGVPFPAAVDSLKLNPGQSTPYQPVHRGIAGLDEVLSFRAYRLAGVPAPPATWVQWRVVMRGEESAKDQYATDLWGLYVAVGELSPALLADRKLPDGITVSVQSGVKHRPPGTENAEKEWEKFLNGMRSNPNEEWWRKNLDVHAFYTFHALNRLLGNVDLRPDGNHGYYRRPDGRWAPIPWDNDMCFVPRHHQPGVIEANNCLAHSAIRREFRNRAREILDLFAADPGDRGGQIGQLATDLAAAITPKGQTLDWSQLDAAMWNRHPRMNQPNTFFVNPTRAEHFGGPWNRTLASNDFNGFRRYLVDFCTDSRPSKNYAPNDGDPRGYGWGYLAHEAKDAAIPATPTIERAAGDDRYRASAFSSPAGHAAAVLEWRVGRIGQRGWYELADHWKTETNGVEATIPADAFREKGEYRVRARWRDATGRCSHWSKPITVTVTAR